MSDQPIPVESSVEPQALAVRDNLPVDRPLTLQELHDNLDFIRRMMAQEMKEGQDYGKIPGCGDKPGLFQPGAQKLGMLFRLTPQVKKEVLRELPHGSIFGHREYEFTVTMKAVSGRSWDGVGTCSTFESKYRYRTGSRKCPKCGKETIFKSKKVNEGWYCWGKKGGCGAQFPPSAPEIVNQSTEKVEHDNPADYWNTIRKIAFKRAQVHGTINATNTSELWSQDLEDLPQTSADDGYIPSQEPEPEPETPPPTTAAIPTKADAAMRLRGLNILKAAPGQPNEIMFRDYMAHIKWIGPNDAVLDWPLERVPTSKKGLQDLAFAASNWHEITQNNPAQT